MADTGKKINKILCSVKDCKKPANHGTGKFRPKGNHIGFSKRLSKSILANHYHSLGIMNQQDHPLSTQPTYRFTYYRGGCPTPTIWYDEKRPSKVYGNPYNMLGSSSQYIVLDMEERLNATCQAHHLIPCEIMKDIYTKEDDGTITKDDSKWKKVCEETGYNIDHSNNGVFLPNSLQIACQYCIPLHRGSHSSTTTDVPTQDGVFLSYVNAVEEETDEIYDTWDNGVFCKGHQDRVSQLLDKLSNDVWELVENFVWTITSDGKNYIDAFDIAVYKKIRIGRPPLFILGTTLAALNKNAPASGKSMAKAATAIRNKFRATKGLGCLDATSITSKYKAMEDPYNSFCKRDHGFPEKPEHLLFLAQKNQIPRWST